MAEVTSISQEQLDVFLEKWIATRTAQVEKYRLRAERYKGKTGMRICYESALRSQQHYQHEVELLRWLQKHAPYAWSV